MLRRTQTLFVCLVFLVLLFSSVSHAWDLTQAAFHGNHEHLASPAITQHSTGSHIQPRKIIKCRPLTDWQASTRVAGDHSTVTESGHTSECALPEHPERGWELAAEVSFTRTKGKVRFSRGNFGAFTGFDEADLNADMGLDDHGVETSFMAMYKFRPKWAVRYSVMPMTMMGSGQAGKSFVFGNTQYTAGQNMKVEWERLEQRLGLVYDAAHSHSSRLSVFGGYVRVTDRIKVMQMQAGMGEDIMDNDLNMGMTGIEFEKCLKTTYAKATLSLECAAGVAFLDDAFGAEAETALKYTIPMNNRRWGFVKGGYKYLTYKKKSSDAKMFDIVMEGGFLQMGLVF